MEVCNARSAHDAGDSPLFSLSKQALLQRLHFLSVNSVFKLMLLRTRETRSRGHMLCALVPNLGHCPSQAGLRSLVALLDMDERDTTLLWHFYCNCVHPTPHPSDLLGHNV